MFSSAGCLRKSPLGAELLSGKPFAMLLVVKLLHQSCQLLVIIVVALFFRKRHVAQSAPKVRICSEEAFVGHNL